MRGIVVHPLIGAIRSSRRLAVIAAVLSLASYLHAQAPGTGALSGRVVDPSGAVIGSAQVVVQSEQTDLSRTARTNAEGWFRVPLLPPGDYSIVLEVNGFKRKTVRSVHVAVAETAVVDVSLEVGAPTTQVQVEGKPELAQTESSTLGRVTDQTTIVALPLANRNFSQILALSPGIVTDVANAANLGRNTQNVSANGAKTTSNNFQFNGVDANNMSQGSLSGFDPETGIAIPAPDTIEEFKVQTGMYDAGYGRGAGANIDFVSKSGTNRFHGNLWEFFRNDALNANDFFLKRDGQARPEFKQNQFGGMLGGPIRKDKTFFFFSYQGLIQIDGDAPGASLVSTLLPPLTNDRSAAALGQLFGGQSGAFGGTAVAADGSNINPVAFALLNFKLADGTFAIPSPQVILPGGVGQSTYSAPARYREDQYSVNIDHSLSQKNQLSGRFFTSLGTTQEPFTPFAATVPGWGTDQNERNDMFVLSDNHAISPNLINVARFGFMRFNGLQSGVDPITAASVGTQSPSGLATLPGIALNNGFTIGPSGEPFYFENTNSFIWQDTVSLTRGRHNLRFGGEAKKHEVDINVAFTSAGFINFLSFPDFLIGQSAAQNGSGVSNIFNSSGASGVSRKDERYSDYAGFVQDDIKISPRLTVNAGLRYEYFSPPSEVHGRLSDFDPSIAPAQVPASGSLVGFVLPANFQGPVAPGVTKTSGSGMFNSDYKDIGPRFGFSLRLLDKPTVVLRGGYGIYYQKLTGQLAFTNIGQVPFSFQQSLFGAENGAATFQQPFNPLLPPASAFPIYFPRTPDSALFLANIDQHITSPYTQQYDLNVQYEITHDLLWQIGYVGSKTTHQTGCVEFNQALIANPQNPVNGLTTTTNENIAQRVPFEGVGSGSYICGTYFSANYNSLQTNLTQRFRRGLEFQASYTYSKNLDYTSGTGGLPNFDLDFLSNDQTNPRQAHGLNDFDRTHRFVLSFVYQPPKLNMGPVVAKRVLSNWQLSGESVLESGLPITPIDSTGGSVYGNLVGFTRAECTGATPASSGSIYDRLNGYFNTAAFAAPPAIGDGTGFGSCGVGILRGPSQLNLDLGVQRNFAVTEGSALQFRAEFFNFTNTPKFGLPDNDHAAGPAFGVISSTASSPRIIQFALKYNF
jgi:Carboxypeptidase regulatory-like domain/TonB-dependent Receptor Plug Domain